MNNQTSIDPRNCPARQTTSAKQLKQLKQAKQVKQVKQVKQAICRRQHGGSLVEFSIIALSVVLVGLFTLQLGLLYHAKTTLNYAVFEAAREGAVNNAKMSAIREALGIRLAPLQGGDGTENSALAAIARSMLALNDPLNTRVLILNPTPAAFRDWAVRDQDSGERFIPVNHLRHQSYDIGRHSGLSLRDATLLKLQVTHGVDLRVPVVGKLMTSAMRLIDYSNAVYYQRGKWPMQSVATVRMQSDALEAEILSNADASTGSSGSSGSSSTGGGTGGGESGGESGGGISDGATSGSNDNTGGELAGGGTAGNDVDQGGGPVREENESEAEEDTVSTPDVLPQCNDGAVLAQSTSARPGTDQMLSTLQFRDVLAAAAPALE